MGSVLGSMKCPYCGGEMIYDYYYRSDEEYRNCLRCGAHQSWSIDRDEDGKAILDENGKPKYTELDMKGYGCIHLYNDKHGGCLWPLDSPVTGDDKKHFYDELASGNWTKESCYFTYVDPVTGEVVVEYGKDPGLYGEEAEADDGKEKL